MTRDQLEGLAQRALKRAHNESSKPDNVTETILRIRTRDLAATKRGLDLVLGEFAREWHAGAMTLDTEGMNTIDYVIRPKKKMQPEELLSLARTAGGSELVDAQIR